MSCDRADGSSWNSARVRTIAVHDLVVSGHCLRAGGDSRGHSEHSSRGGHHAHVAVPARRRSIILGWTACSAASSPARFPRRLCYEDERSRRVPRHQSAGAYCTCSSFPGSTSRPRTISVADDDALVGRMLRRAAQLAADEGFGERGYRTVFNCNREAGQTVFHLHLHLLAGRGLDVASRLRR